MPAPDPAVMKQHARERFRTFGVVLPDAWVAPANEIEKQQFEASGANAPGEPLPGDALFRAATPSAQHRAIVLANHEIVGGFLDGVCAALCEAWSEWQRAATLDDVRIDGATASGGKLSGPSWKATIVARGPSGSRQLKNYTRAVAVAIADAWSEFQSSVHIPDLHWYPALATVATPEAPPTPNEATAFAALTQNTTPLGARTLADAMTAALADPGAMHQAEIFASVAHAFECCFRRWQTDTRVTQVIAHGRPAAPNGPVVNGRASMAAGGLD
jgi:hypothetical protein